jgi:hypothetical protein
MLIHSGFPFQRKRCLFWTTPAPLDGTQYHFDFNAFLTAMTSVDIILDVAVLCLPLLVIYNLRMSFKAKILVAGIFLQGSL